MVKFLTTTDEKARISGTRHRRKPARRRAM
jgi:hypothetical protein